MPKMLSNVFLKIFIIITAFFVVSASLFAAGRFEKILSPRGLNILTKLTGLFVSAIAAQIFFTGLKNFLR
jgi:multiple antibiotic resistance protein